MYDLFDFEMDTEPFTHLTHQYPWEYNPPGTKGSRVSADMDFSEPDQVDGRLLYQTSMEMEYKEARTLPNRLREKAVRLWLSARNKIQQSHRSAPAESGPSSHAPSPETALEWMVQYAAAENLEAFMGMLDSGYQGFYERYAGRKRAMNAYVMPENPAELLFQQFEELRPRPISETVENNRATVRAMYNNGISAELEFTREGNGWKFNLTHHLEPTLRRMDDSWAIQDTYEKMKEESNS